MLKTKKQTVSQRLASLEKTVDQGFADFNSAIDAINHRLDEWEEGFASIATDVKHVKKTSKDQFAATEVAVGEAVTEALEDFVKEKKPLLKRIFKRRG